MSTRHHPQRVARTSTEDTSESDDDESSSDTEANPRVARAFGKQPSKGAGIHSQSQPSQPPRQTQGKWNYTPNYRGCQVSNGCRDREMFESYSRDFE